MFILFSSNWFFPRYVFKKCEPEKLYLRKYCTLQVGHVVVSISNDELMKLLCLRRKEAGDMKLLTNLPKIWSKWLSCLDLMPSYLSCVGHMCWLANAIARSACLGVFRKAEKNNTLEDFGYFQDFCRLLTELQASFYLLQCL